MSDGDEPPLDAADAGGSAARETEAAGPFADRPPILVRMLTLRNFIGIGLLMVLLVVFFAGGFIRNPDVTIRCVADPQSSSSVTTVPAGSAPDDDDPLATVPPTTGLVPDEPGLKDLELAESRQVLDAWLVAEIADNRLRLTEVESRLPASTTTSTSSTPPTTSSSPETTSEPVDDAVDRRLLEDERDRLRDEMAKWTRALNALREPTRATYSPPRSGVVLSPQEPVAKISLGSDRNPRRVEVVLVQSTGASEESGDTPNDSSAENVQPARLPRKPEYLAVAGQFRRSSGVEIPRDQVAVWARPVGGNVLLSVCITPTSEIDAGSYKGAVYVVDPSLNTLTVPVEITAQSTQMNWLFALLFISPTLAFAYVWFTSRHMAGANPWDPRAFKKWAGDNFVLAFAVGFAAVWASLAVPFSNPTWGSSVLGSLAIVGVGLVGAVTAMTAVAGRVREPDD